MLRGLMMDEPLLVSSLIVHADKFHGDTEIVSRTVEGPGKDGAGAVHRYTYRDAHRRARQLAQALGRLGVKQGDRVGTLAWNGYRHFELYFGVSGMGAVIHTINPRLFPEQIVYIVNHAEDKYVFFDLTFAPLVEKLAGQCQGVKGWVAMTDRAHMPQSAIPNLLCYEELRRGGERRLRVAAVRRVDRGRALLHLGHDRATRRACCTRTARRSCTRTRRRCPTSSRPRRA